MYVYYLCVSFGGGVFTVTSCSPGLCLQKSLVTSVENVCLQSELAFVSAKLLGAPPATNYLSKISLTLCTHAGSVNVNHQSTWFLGILKEDFFYLRRDKDKDRVDKFSHTFPVLHGFYFYRLLFPWRYWPFRVSLTCSGSTVPPDSPPGCWNLRLWVKGQQFSLKQLLSLVSTQHAGFALWLYFLPLCIFLTLLLIHLIKKILKHLINHF